MAERPDHDDEGEREQDRILEQGLSSQLSDCLVHSSPPEWSEMDQKKIEELYDHSKGINLLVTGRVGSGKSTIVNGFIGPKFVDENDCAYEGDEIDRHGTTSVKSFQSRRKFGSFAVQVWDSPGLNDGTSNNDEYLEQIYTECHDFDLCLFCIRINSTRSLVNENNEEIPAMKMLHKKFGNDFWRKTVIVLTFANLITTISPSKWRRLKGEARVEAYRDQLERWKSVIKCNLINFVEVNEAVVEQIKFVPAGHYEELHLPDRKFWFSALWFQCLNAIPTTEAKLALLRQVEDRLQVQENVDEQMLPDELHHHPIIVDPEFLKMRKKYGIRGAVIGALVGIPLVLIGGVFTIPLGYIIGKKVGEKKYNKTKKTSELLPINDSS